MAISRLRLLLFVVMLTACVAPARLAPTPALGGVPSTSALAATPGAWWQPPLRASWQWQLDALPLDLSVEAAIFDVDLFDTAAGTVAELHQQGRRVICYLSAGAWENWRPDAGQFPPAVLGKDYAGWPGERWLDIRRIDLLAPVMSARLDQCRDKGFDAVEPDNIDGYLNDTGFPLSYADQLAYNRWLAEQAHARGLAIGLKNDAEQAADLLPWFDWALTESCFAEGWCEELQLFIDAGKPVFAAEYTDTGVTLQQLCSQARALHFNVLLKRRSLDAWRDTCPEQHFLPLVRAGL